MSTQSIKTIITDFDETLWSGVIAEGEKPKLNREYCDFLKSLYHKGFVLFGLTKNDGKDVDCAFKELKLDKDIFVVIIANWESKAHNIELLFQQLELRADTTLFIDDNPLELNEVKSKISGIGVLNAKDWKKIKKYISLQKSVSTQKGILDRYHKYRHALRFFDARKIFKGTDSEFFRTWKRSIQIGSPRSRKEMERVAELFFRTNRLNFNRRPLSSIQELLEYLKQLKESGHVLQAVSIKDGGAMLGIQAAFTWVVQGKKALVTNGTISCSTMTFGDLETKIINELLKLLFQQADLVEILVRETPTNNRVREVLKDFHFTVTKDRKDRYRFALEKQNFKEHDVPWINVIQNKKMIYEYIGVPSVKDYFLRYEWKRVKSKSDVVVLGVGQGETLGVGLTQKFVRHLKSIHAKYYPVDIEDYGTNIVADAEDLHKFFRDESVDYIICTELLEHTEHYWEVINEMFRILKIGGRIFFSVPYNYPPHEYPIDKWRLSYPYLKKVFSMYCKIERVKFIGNKKFPRHIIMSLVKIKPFVKPITQANGKVDWSTGLVYV